MSDKKPIVIWNAGAGGVGKTTVANRVKDFAPAFGRKVVTIASSTRAVYAKLGINTEKEGTEQTPEEQFFLQGAIIDAVYENQRKGILDNQDADLIMIDRSPLDHISYELHNLAKHMTMDDLRQRIARCYAFIEEMSKHAGKLVLLYYPFPEPWHVEKESSDGFRFDKGGKNFLWACVLEKLISEALTATDSFWVLDFPTAGMTVEERARYILDISKL